MFRKRFHYVLGGDGGDSNSWYPTFCAVTMVAKEGVLKKLIDVKPSCDYLCSAEGPRSPFLSPLNVNIIPPFTF